MTRVKHIATDLMNCSLDTGYDYDYLCEQVESLMKDGEPMDKAAEEIIEIAYEGDL